MTRLLEKITLAEMFKWKTWESQLHHAYPNIQLLMYILKEITNTHQSQMRRCEPTAAGPQSVSVSAAELGFSTASKWLVPWSLVHWLKQKVK